MNNEEKNKVGKVKIFIKELIPYIVILIIVVLIRTYIVTPIMVNGQSMYPTLNGSELMILNKLDNIERFDIVVVDTGHDEIIKRVIAMPGETISCEDGIIYVNGRKQEESYSTGVTSDFKKVKLGKDEYFVLGDNREDSLDSRYYGPFNKEKVEGTAKLILFPLSKFGNVE